MTPEPGRSSPVPPNRGEPVTVSGGALRLALTRWGDPSAWDVDGIIALVVQAEAEAAALERERLLTEILTAARKRHIEWHGTAPAEYMDECSERSCISVAHLFFDDQGISRFLADPVDEPTP